MKNPFIKSVVQYPVYHGSNTIFDKFEVTSDIGYHFGTESAALDRMAKTGGAPEFEIREAFPTKLQWYQYRIKSGLRTNAKTDADKLRSELIRTLDNPNLTLIINEINKMDDAEISEMLDELADKPTSKSVDIGYEKYINSPNEYQIVSNDEVIDTAKDRNEAEAKLHQIKKQYLKPRKFWISIQHPIEMKDLGTWSVLDIVREMNLDEDIVEYIMSGDTLDEKYDRLRKEIMNRGYDGIVYTNKVEDTGSTSYIVFDNDQIKEINPPLFESHQDRFKYAVTNEWMNNNLNKIEKYYQSLFERLFRQSDVSDFSTSLRLGKLSDKYSHLSGIEIRFISTKNDEASFVQRGSHRYIIVPTPSSYYKLVDMFTEDYLKEVHKLFPDVKDSIALEYLQYPGQLSQYKFDDGSSLFNSYYDLYKKYKDILAKKVNTLTRGLLTHEIVHAIDSTDFDFSEKPIKTKYDYYNAPHERNAYLVGLLSEVGLDKPIDEILSNGKIKQYLDIMSPNNRKRMIKRIHDIKMNQSLHESISSAKSMSLNDIYGSKWDVDDSEVIHNFVELEDEWDIQFPVKTYTVNELKQLQTAFGQDTVFDAYKNASKEQQKIVSHYRNNDKDRNLQPIVVANKTLLDGYHRLIAAIIDGSDIQGIDVYGEEAIPLTESLDEQVKYYIDHIDNIKGQKLDSMIESIIGYHGTSSRFDEFNDYKPNFFAIDKDYASMYRKGDDKHRIIKAELDINRPFDTRTDKDAVLLYNDRFIPFAKKRNTIIPPITIGNAISFTYADYLFAYLRKLDREEGIQYDGIIVDEGYNKNLSIVPLYNTQINVISKSMNESVEEYKDIIVNHTVPELVNYNWNKIAFGISTDDIINLPLEKLNIKWHEDMKNVNGYDMKKYFGNIDPSQLPPIEVSFDGDKFYIEDGHHRYGYHKQLGLKTIPSIIEITANPFKKLGFTIDDVVDYKNTLLESININYIKQTQDITMKQSKRFMSFLESLKNSTNATLIESIKKGFTLIEEVDMGQADRSLYSSGRATVDMVVDGKVIESDVFSRSSIMRKANKMGLNEVTIRTHNRLGETYDTDYIKDSDGDWVKK